MEQKRTPGRQAHLYALLSWYGANSLDEAEKLVDTLPYSELDGKTYAETSISAATKGIQEKIFNSEVEVGPETDLSKYKLVDDPAVYDAVVEILVAIHDKWVRENAKKYDRGNEEKSLKNIYQHTPTALIGLDEVAKDLMFFAPFMKELGLDAGEMEMKVGGNFVPSKQVAEAYQRYVEKYKAANKIASSNDLEEHVKDCIHGKYEPLAPVSEMAEKRAKYMEDHISTIISEIKGKNPQSFGALKSEGQPE